MLRGRDIYARVVLATDSTPFLIGGWVKFAQADCFIDPERPTSPLLAPCDDGFRLVDGDTITRLVVGRRVPGVRFRVNEPTVLRVHVHDTRARKCPPEIRLECEQAVVVEAGVWRLPGASLRTPSTPP